MAEIKIVAASIIKFLKQQLDSDKLSVDSRESVEVGVQCLETAFEVGSEDVAKGLDLVKLVKDQIGPSQVPAERKAEAERYKNEGNELIKSERYREALDMYTRAVQCDPSNAVYFCNRAAAYYKLGDYEATVADCTAALALQPEYSKALGRLGLALMATARHREALAAYQRAARLDPDNDSYRTNIRIIEEKLAAEGERPAMNLGGLLQNPALMTMATEMLADPNMQNLISGLMNNTAATGGGAAGAGGMNALLEAGQALAQHMQAANPELVEQLRRQVGPRPPNSDNQPGQ